MSDERKIPQHIQIQQRYYALRERCDVAERTYEEAKRAMREAEEELVEAMLDDGVERFSLKDGTTVFLKPQTFISVTQKNTAEIEEWLTEVEGDAAPFQKTVLDKAEIVDKVTTRLAEGSLSPMDLPDCLNFTQKPRAYVRGWKGRRIPL